MRNTWEEKNYHELIESCDAIIRENRQDHITFYYRGLANEALHLFENSIKDFEQANLILHRYTRPSWVKEYFCKVPIQMSRVYRKMQNQQKAFEYADVAVKADRKGVEGLTYRAALKADFGDNKGALEDLNEALRRRPKDEQVLKNRNLLTYHFIQDQRNSST